MKVYKYPFPITDEFTLDMPRDPLIVLVECQDGQPTLWAEVDPTRPIKSYSFRIFGTGHSIEQKNLRHINSFQMPPFVWHLYQEGVTNGH